MSNKIFTLIPKIMGELGAIEKKGFNKNQNYSFRSAEDVAAALQPLLTKYGVFIVPEVLSQYHEERRSSTGGTLVSRVLHIKYIFYADDGSNFSTSVVAEGMDSGDKASNKAMTAGFKYNIVQTFCVPSKEHKDSEDDNHDVGSTKTTPPTNTSAASAQPAYVVPMDVAKGPTTLKKISPAQVSRLWGITKSRGIHSDFVHTNLRSMFGLESVKDLDWKQYKVFVDDWLSNVNVNLAEVSQKDEASNIPPPLGDDDIPF